MTHEQRFLEEDSVTVTSSGAENLGRVPWAVQLAKNDDVFDDG